MCWICIVSRWNKKCFAKQKCHWLWWDLETFSVSSVLFLNALSEPPLVREEMPACLVVMQPVSEILLRWTSYFQSRHSQYTTLAEPRWMMIMKIIIENSSVSQHFPPPPSKLWGDESSFLETVSICFSKKRQTRKCRNEKRSKRAESTVRCGDFGTYASAQLPIYFENGPMQVENSIFISAKERCAVKCKGM